MPRSLMSAAGRPVRERALGRYLTATTVLGAGGLAWSLGLAARDGIDPVFAVCVGLALLLAHTGHLVTGITPDSHGYAAEELVLTAALLVAPSQIGPALLLFVVGLRPALVRLGVVERMRNASGSKVLFNAAAPALAAPIAQMVTLAAVGLGPVAAAVLGSSTYFLVTSVLTVGVVTAASGQRPPRTLASFRWPATGWATCTAVGAAVGAALHPLPLAPVGLLATGAIVYGLARLNVSSLLKLETQDRLLDVAPRILGAADPALDETILRVARELLSSEHAVLAPVGAAAGQVSVPIAGPDGSEDHLVVWGRLGEHRRYDREDRDLLAGLARLAGPARQQQRLLSDLQRSEESRGAIVGALAHDLRAPLATASIAIDTAREHQERLTPERLEGVLASAKRGLDRALTILEDLLSLERVRHDPITGTHADVAVVAATIAAAHPDAVTLTGDGPLEARIDGRVLSRIVDNLVTNAIKHAPGSPVRVGWGLDGEGRVTVTVEDDGAGIPEELRDDITGAFRRGGGPVAGVGLGLYLARRFTELADGCLSVGESASGGARITVALPVAASGDPGERGWGASAS